MAEHVIGMFYADISLCEFKDSLSWKVRTIEIQIRVTQCLLVTNRNTIEKNMKLHTLNRNVVNVWR